MIVSRLEKKKGRKERMIKKERDRRTVSWPDLLYLTCSIIYYRNRGQQSCIQNRGGSIYIYIYILFSSFSQGRIYVIFFVMWKWRKDWERFCVIYKLACVVCGTLKKIIFLKIWTCHVLFPIGKDWLIMLQYIVSSFEVVSCWMFGSWIKSHGLYCWINTIETKLTFFKCLRCLKEVWQYKRQVAFNPFHPTRPFLAPKLIFYLIHKW